MSIKLDKLQKDRRISVFLLNELTKNLSFLVLFKNYLLLYPVKLLQIKLSSQSPKNFYHCPSILLTIFS